MKSVFVVLLAVSAFAAASVLPKITGHTHIADKDFLMMQQNMLHLLVRPHQHNLYKEQVEIGKTYSIESHLGDYTNVKAVKEFLHVYNQGMLPKGEIFTVFYPEYLEQAIHLFDIFFFAKDLDTFYKTACWARDHVNEGMFTYAFSVAVLHREDCKYFILPPPYEVYPHLFHHDDVIQKAYEVRMQGEHYTGVDGVFKLDNRFIIHSNYSGMVYTKHREQMLSYFTEDVGLNTFNTYLHLDYPFWMNFEKYNLKFDRRGELFYYTQHQIMARYCLERLSNGLGDLKHFDWMDRKTNMVGYESGLHYHNGHGMTLRPEGLTYTRNHLTEDAMIMERRILDAIDAGYVLTFEGLKISLKEKEGITILGDMIMGAGDSHNMHFYGKMYYMMCTIFGHVMHPTFKYDMGPSVLENYMTALRDPIYYTMYMRMEKLFHRYKTLLPTYTTDELLWKGIHIENVEIDKLITYFDKFDMDLDNVVDVGIIEDGEHVNIQARQMRLNHKPFTYKVKVNCDKDVTAMVRVFLGPKFDFYGNEMSLDMMRDYMVELDRFVYNVKVGSNMIERNSIDSSVTMKDMMSYRTLMMTVGKALTGEGSFEIDETHRHCGWPQRLLLPKGKKSGMDFRFFVMVTPFEGKSSTNDMSIIDMKSLSYCGVKHYGVFPDVMPMGYPFDRVIDNYDHFLKAPNMFWKDVMIYHNKMDYSPMH